MLGNPLPKTPGFYCLQYKSFGNTAWKKEKLLVLNNFSFSHSVFYPFGECSAIFIKFEKNCHLQIFQFGSVQNLLFGKRFKTETHFEMGKKRCGKRRKCCLPAFSLFPTMFSKGFFFRVVKSRDCVGKSQIIWLSQSEGVFLKN